MLQVPPYNLYGASGNLKLKMFSEAGTRIYILDFKVNGICIFIFDYRRTSINSNPDCSFTLSD